MSLNELLVKANQLEVQNKNTEAGALLIDAIDAVIEDGTIPEAVPLLLLRIGLNFMGTDLELNGIESIQDAVGQLGTHDKALKNLHGKLLPLLLAAVRQVARAGKLDVAQQILRAILGILEQGKFKDADFFEPIITQALLHAFGGNTSEAQKFAKVAADLNQKVKDQTAPLLIQIILTLAAISDQDAKNAPVRVKNLLEASASFESYPPLALAATIAAKWCELAGSWSDAYCWWGTAQSAARLSKLPQLELFAGQRMTELESAEAESAATAPPEEITAVPASPLAAPLPAEAQGDREMLVAPEASTPADEGTSSHREELYHQIESLKQLVADLDASLPTAKDPAAVRQQKTLYRKTLRELQNEYESLGGQ